MEAGTPNLPERINHPAHGQWKTLVLQVVEEYILTDDGFTWHRCNICLNRVEKGDYIYACDGKCSDPDCEFKVDIACSSVKAGVDFLGHEHLLFLVERLNPSCSLRCHSCEGRSNELVFCCNEITCDYTLHLSCGPLPVAIQYHHSGHELTLTLMDSLLDGADPEDSWCDICEEQRDPRKCVYRSEDPPFTATIDCLLPQIVGALQGDHGDVRVRTVRGHTPGNVIVTAQESTKQGSGEEKSVLHGDAEEVIMERKIEINAADVEDNVDFTFSSEKFIASHDENCPHFLPQEEAENMNSAFTEGMDIYHSVIPFKFSDEAFEQFKEHAIAITGAVDFSRLMSFRFEEKIRFVKVGSNLVYPELVPLYQQLIDKHGDFTAGCPLSPAGKATLLMFLLMLIQGIQGVQICEMTGDLLCSLQFFLELTGSKLGFDVQFARDNLEQLGRACYALKFVKARDDIIADLSQKIEQLERDIPEDKPKIEALKEQYRRGKESAFVKQCLAEASALKWKNAGEFLGLDQVE